MNANLEYQYRTFIQTKCLKPGIRPTRVKATNLTSGKYVVVTWDNAYTVMENHLLAVQALMKRETGDTPPSDFIVCGTRDEKGYIVTYNRS